MIVHETKVAQIDYCKREPRDCRYIVELKRRICGESGFHLVPFGAYPTQQQAQQAINREFYPHLVKKDKHHGRTARRS